MAWQEIDSSEIAAGAPITQELLQKLAFRDHALLEGPAGGRWDERTVDGPTGAVKFLTLYVPRGASTVFFECVIGIADPGTDPKARIYLHDTVSDKYAYGEFTSLKGLRTANPDNPEDTFHFGRVAFPAVVIDPDDDSVQLRGKVVECFFDVSDAVGSSGTFHIVNKGIRDPDPTLALLLWSRDIGFGVRFGGPLGPEVAALEPDTTVTEGLETEEPLIVPGITALPTAALEHHRKLYVLKRGTGLEDYLCICLKGNDDAYRWITIGQGGP